MMSRRFLPAAISAAGLLGLVGCGEDGQGNAPSSGGEAGVAKSASAPSAAAAPAPSGGGSSKAQSVPKLETYD